MALVLADRVKETTTSIGTGTITLAGAVAGFQSFAVVGNANTTFYTISGGSQWEVGIGTYTSSGTTLSRDTVLSSSSAGALVDFAAGTKDVFVTYPAERSVYTTASAELAIPAPGTTGNVLTSNGTTWASTAGAVAANVQTFSSSGTWTKPTGAQFHLVELWGAGGGGGTPTAGAANPAGGGGGGGSYVYRWFLASQLGSSEPVAIGAGGTAGGGVGGSSIFGTTVYAYGGGGGRGNATGASVQSGGGGGGTQAVGAAVSGGGPNILDAVSGSIIPAQINGGGRGGGPSISGATTLNQVEGSSSVFGGGGGAGQGTGIAYQTNSGGGSSQYGGGGGGAGGRSTAGGSTTAVNATLGGGPKATAIATASFFFGASGGGQPPIYGLASPPAADPFQGGGGGLPVTSAPAATSSGVAVSGSQTVLLGQITVQGGTYGILFVSVDGLANYTPYLTGRSFGTAGIIFDGSKYVMANLQGASTGVSPSSFYRSIFSTTNFTTFTDHSTSGIVGNLSAGGSSVGCLFKYLNGLYFICGDTDLFYSSDLNSWTRANINSGVAIDIRGIAYDGTYYYALTATTVRRSANLSTWTSYALGITTASALAASPTLVVVAVSSGLTRYSADQGVTWADSPTIAANAARSVAYFPATGDWILTTSANTMYYTTDPTVSWNLSAVSGIYGLAQAGYNGTRYILPSANSASGVAYTSTTAAGTFASQAVTALPTAATPGSPGGVAGGGGGGAASSTTTTTGGAGGNGFCRVYTW